MDYGADLRPPYHHCPAEDGSGAGQSYDRPAIKDAGNHPGGTSHYVNAHGTSTHHNGLFEDQGHQAGPGRSRLRREGQLHKSMIRPLNPALPEAWSSSPASNPSGGVRSSTVGLENGRGCDLDYVQERGVNMEVNYAISNLSWLPEATTPACW